MNPTKREVLFSFLHEPSGALVHLDPRREGVVVPERLRTQHQLVLQIGLRFARPIRDLELTNEGFAATLSFSQKPFHCTIPWSAVFAIVPAGDRAPIVWRDDALADQSDYVIPHERIALTRWGGGWAGTTRENLLAHFAERVELP